MDWCGADGSCWMLWLNDTGIRLAQVCASLWLGWLALNGPKKERSHQAKKELIAKVEHAISVLKVLAATGERLKLTGKLLDDWLNDEGRENAQLRRIRANLELDDKACSDIPLNELSDQKLIDAVLDISKQPKLLMLAIDDFLSTCRPVADIEIITVGIMERAGAFKDLSTARLYLCLSEVDKKIASIMTLKNEELEALKS